MKNKLYCKSKYKANNAETCNNCEGRNTWNILVKIYNAFVINYTFRVKLKNDFNGI